jgi:hypothetical protein
MSLVARTAVEDAQPNRSECWCCGATADPGKMVRLGNHPEVALCLRCAHWAAKQAGEIEDRGRSGPLVVARERLRAARAGVVRRGWHRSRLVGGPLRWLGKRLP